MSTPLIQDGQIYGADSSGVLRCLRLETFAYRHVFARNDEVLVCADLSVAEKP